MKIINKLFHLSLIVGGFYPLFFSQTVFAFNQESNIISAYQSFRDGESPIISEEEANYLYRQGIQLYQQGEYDKAEEKLQQSLEIRERIFGSNHLDVAASLDGLAVVYGMQGRYSESETLHLQALKIREEKLGENHPEVAMSLDGLAWLYQEQQRYDEAIAMIERALEILATQGNVFRASRTVLTFQLGTIYHQQGEFNEAITNYQDTLTLDSQYWLALVNLGLLAYESNNIKQAIDYWQSALAITGDAVEAKIALAIAFYKQGETTEGLRLGKVILKDNQEYLKSDFLVKNLWGKKLLADARIFFANPQIQEITNKHRTQK